MSKFKNTKKPLDSTKSGFTIIEVTLVTAFMAMLLIAIAVITTSIAALYQKGLTLKAVNSVGRNLITEFTTSINSAPSIDSVSLCNTLIRNPNHINDAQIEACLRDNAYKYVYYSLEGQVENPDTHANERVQYGGIMCTGNYSYVWNTHYGLEDSNPSLSLKYRYPNPNAINNYLETTESGFRLIRFRDRTYRACSTIMYDNQYKVSNVFENNHVIDITRLANGTPNSTNGIQGNFLEASGEGAELDLYLYELTIFPVSQDSVTLRSFFSGTFILATDRGGVNIIRTGDYCDVSSESRDTTEMFSLGSEFNYCGINKFNFAARTSGSGV